MNQTIIAMLKTLSEHEKTTWKDHVNKLVHAYNCTKHSTTGYSPYFLLFGRKPRLPIDILLPQSKEQEQNHIKYVDKWKSEMKQAYKIASKQSAHRKQKDVERHDTRKPCSMSLHPGDRVLVRNMSERGGTGKMRSHWEDKVHIVVSGIGDSAVVFKVRPENEVDGKVRILHRNMLLLCDHLLDNFDWSISKNSRIESDPEVVQLNQKISKQSTKRKKLKQVVTSEEESSSDDEKIQFTPRVLQKLSGEGSKESKSKYHIQK